MKLVSVCKGKRNNSAMQRAASVKRMKFHNRDMNKHARNNQSESRTFLDARHDITEMKIEPLDEIYSLKDAFEWTVAHKICVVAAGMLL